MSSIDDVRELYNFIVKLQELSRVDDLMVAQAVIRAVYDGWVGKSAMDFLSQPRIMLKLSKDVKHLIRNGNINHGNLPIPEDVVSAKVTNPQLALWTLLDHFSDSYSFSLPPVFFEQLAKFYPGYLEAFSGLNNAHTDNFINMFSDRTPCEAILESEVSEINPPYTEEWFTKLHACMMRNFNKSEPRVMILNVPNWTVDPKDHKRKKRGKYNKKTYIPILAWARRVGVKTVLVKNFVGPDGRKIVNAPTSLSVIANQAAIDKYGHAELAALVDYKF